MSGITKQSIYGDESLGEWDPNLDTLSISSSESSTPGDDRPEASSSVRRSCVRAERYCIFDIEDFTMTDVLDPMTIAESIFCVHSIIFHGRYTTRKILSGILVKCMIVYNMLTEMAKDPSLRDEKSKEEGFYKKGANKSIKIVCPIHSESWPEIPSTIEFDNWVITTGVQKQETRIHIRGQTRSMCQEEFVYYRRYFDSSETWIPSQISLVWPPVMDPQARIDTHEFMSNCRSYYWSATHWSLTNPMSFVSCFPIKEDDGQKLHDKGFFMAPLYLPTYYPDFFADSDNVRYMHLSYFKEQDVNVGDHVKGTKTALDCSTFQRGP